jgi:hypothetical protein
MNHIDMSVHDLLAWAHDETKLADALEGSAAEFARLAGADLALTIARHRDRSRWLDEQVARILDERDAK